MKCLWVCIYSLSVKLLPERSVILYIPKCTQRLQIHWHEVQTKSYLLLPLTTMGSVVCFGHWTKTLLFNRLQKKEEVSQFDRICFFLCLFADNFLVYEPILKNLFLLERRHSRNGTMVRKPGSDDVILEKSRGTFENRWGD